jgi:hypothetical protein
MTLTISVKRGDKTIVCRLFESEHYSGVDGVEMVRMLDPTPELQALAARIGELLKDEKE